MILKTIDIVTLYRKLVEISNREGLKIPVKLSFKLLRNGKAIESIVMAFKEASNRAIMEYATPIEGTEGKVEISSEDFKIVQSQIKELEEAAIEIDLLPIKLSEIEELDLTMQDLAGLYPIIVNEEV